MTLLIYCKNQNKSIGREISHYPDLVIIDPLRTNAFDKSWFNHEMQVVIYTSHLGKYSILNFNWKEAIDNNPKIKFIIYYSGKDLEEIKDWMIKNKFDHPILFDPEKRFYSKNVKDRVSSIAYILRDNRIIKASNPSIPSFQEDLNNLIQDK
ncbi:hypothetical protein [Algoriphagus algorifonticola]|uniref:hypothetical protein n=1 Tax=Algoriphagus algorifonticola TaxID=2593007 RepID=UPI0011AA0FD6|nr:hypothetical protein [Algoriphagus algorifonticola]